MKSILLTLFFIFTIMLNGNSQTINKEEKMDLLAKNLINYSVSLKNREKILIVFDEGSEDLIKKLLKEVYKIGGIPFIKMETEEIKRSFLLGVTVPQIELMKKWDSMQMNEMDAYIRVTNTYNPCELSDVPEEKYGLYQKFYEEPVSDIRTSKKWCKIRYPNPCLAQLAGMSTEGFEDFYFKVSTLDYKKMGEAMDPLVKLMEKTDKVRIVGKGTDISFSIKGIPVVKCCGKRNIPDGEVYSAPIKDSVNGVITYNVPSVYMGTTFDNISLEFKNGKVINKTSNNTEKLKKILKTDEGSEYIGEFAIGLNPYIEKPMKVILFDEKISGSLHLTLGDAYARADNGNQSAIHWDLICIQTPEYGGGEIWFDGKLIRKDGRFVIPELEGLNPENLK